MACAPAQSAAPPSRPSARKFPCAASPRPAPRSSPPSCQTAATSPSPCYSPLARDQWVDRPNRQLSPIAASLSNFAKHASSAPVAQASNTALFQQLHNNLTSRDTTRIHDNKILKPFAPFWQLWVGYLGFR